MTALDVISLDGAKEYLRVDYDDQDNVITRNIKTAVSLIEEYTNVFLYEREKQYAVIGYCGIEIFDYPITITDSSLKKKQNVLSITVFDKIGNSVAATVGYSDVDDIPANLIDACYKLITYLYENRDSYTATLPADVQLLVNQFRRNATI